MDIGGEGHTWRLMEKVTCTDVDGQGHMHGC